MDIWYGGKLPGMNAKVQIDTAGRVVLPKKIRERFRLEGGDTLMLEVKGDAIELRPQKPTAQLRRVNGVLVLVSEMSLPLEKDLVAGSRNERIDEIVRGAVGER
jgi:AbrB family looped-hinge helix DNA binding protein